VPAPEVEALVCEALRREVSTADEISDKDLTAQHVGKVIMRRDRIEVELQRGADREEAGSVGKLVIPFSPTASAQKGITREPNSDRHIDSVAREKLLNAIRRATSWVEAVRSGEAGCFDEIAAQERVGERHVRRLSVLAFLSPNLLNAIANCTASAEVTVSVLTEALPHCWAKQELFGVISPMPEG
jgi:hypothetical protein